MSRIVLYQYIPLVRIPFCLDEAQRDIVMNFSPAGYLFSVSQIANRVGEKRQRVRRSIRRLEKIHAAHRVHGGYKEVYPPRKIA